MSKYYLTARLTPAILTSIPICTFYYYFISPLIFSGNNEIHWLSPVGNITLMSGVIILLVQLNRFLAKEIFQRLYFKDEMEMPTTNYLMHNNTHYNVEIKRTIKEKIKDDFGIEIFDVNRENKDEHGARQQIVMAVSQIRAFLKGNAMLYRHNIEYGFIRNLLGGSVMAVFFSILMSVLFKINSTNTNMFWVSVGLAGIYFLHILFSKTLINRYGKYYAQILYTQYLITKK